MIAGLLTILSVSACSKTPPLATDRQVKTETSDIVQLTADALKKIEIKTVQIHQQVVRDDIVTTGQIQSDENRVFHINSLAPGRVIDDKVILGDVIRQGQTLAIIENLEVAKIYADFIRRFHENDVEIKDAETKLALAKSSLARTQQLYDENIAPH